jgi:hypothetical protein
MRLQQFIIQENRGLKLDIEDAVGIIQDYCMKSYEGYINGSRIYRGMQYDTDYYYIDPKVGKPRVSANTMNYYTLINDNSPYWKGYPKRSESLICTTDKNISEEYGISYVVLPYDGAKVGVCPANDYWFSFEKSINNILDQFNKELKRLFIRFGVSYSDESFSGIVKTLKMVEKEIKKTEPKKVKWLTSDIHFMKGYKEGSDILKHIQELLSPKKNGFTIKKPHELSSYKSKEVWTDSRSVLIKENKMNVVKKMI